MFLKSTDIFDFIIEMAGRPLHRMVNFHALARANKARDSARAGSVEFSQEWKTGRGALATIS
jgi:hypothetical protein